MPIDPSVLAFDCERTTESITQLLRHHVFTSLRRKGAVVLVSGGVDSSVCLALCLRALGRDRVLAVAMPERDSSPASTQLGRLVAERFGVPFLVEDIGQVLEAAGCYSRQEEAIRTVFPDYGAGWKSKIVMPSILEGDRLNISRLVVENPAGESVSRRLTATAYLELVAATNFKQRTRTMMGYYHADRLNYAFCGTPNRLEYDQGFFVKGGDGLADVKPIAHLYKTQVYQLGRYLGVPDEILRRPPTTDTFSLAQSQEEFYFRLPYEKMDICLYGHNHGMSPSEIAEAAGLTPEQVDRVYADIVAKRRHGVPLHLGPLMCGAVPEVAEMVDKAATANPEAEHK